MVDKANGIISIEFVCITNPAIVGNTPHEIAKHKLLWKCPSNNSKLYAKTKNPSNTATIHSNGTVQNHIINSYSIC